MAQSKKQYVANVQHNFTHDECEIEGYGVNAQVFHKTVMCEHIDFKNEQILSVYNAKGKQVFDIRKGFFGS
jgi:hypothetical protein